MSPTEGLGPSEEESASRVCVVIPTYNNEGTLDNVVRDVLEQDLPVIVVDDGCSDGSAAILAAFEDAITVVRHEVNRGKGAALATGLRAAQERGFTHAVTLDSDGQHLAKDIPRFVEAIAVEPAALLLGARDLVAAGAGKGSRFGNAMSSFWVWVETGCRLPDTQTGFRSYPVDAVLALELRGEGFNFEVEVLVKASWSGVPLRSVPIDVEYQAAGERVSHMRPVVDFLRIAWLNTQLTTARVCLPPLFLTLYCQRSFRALEPREKLRRAFVTLVYEEPGTHRRIIGSVALGLFMGIAPFWGFQIALTLLLAHLLNASKTIAVLASNISMPIMAPAIWYGSLVVGRWILNEEGRNLMTLVELKPVDIPAFVVGGFALALVVALIGSLLTWIGLAVFGAKDQRETAA